MKRQLLLIRRVQGISMLPTLNPGSIVLATGWIGRINLGDVIIFNHRGLDKIKRVTDISKKGIFVSGDNSKGSTDSRQFGWIKQADIVGRVFWPRSS